MSSLSKFIELAEVFQHTDANVSNPSLAHLLKIQNAVVDAATVMATELDPTNVFK